MVTRHSPEIPEPSWVIWIAPGGPHAVAIQVAKASTAAINVTDGRMIRIGLKGIEGVALVRVGTATIHEKDQEDHELRVFRAVSKVVIVN